MSDIWSFSYNGHELRAVLRKGEIWMVVTDLGRAIHNANPQRHARDHCRAPQRLAVPGPDATVSMVCITGRDIDRFCQCANPPADALQAYITGIIQPEIRRQAQVEALAAPNTPAPRPFIFDGATVRTVEIDGEPWFVARDVAEVLGYTNPLKAIRDHCKGVNETFAPSAGGEQKIKIIPERDVYRLIMRSKLPAAERFENWVVSEVLPAIRKTGAYNAVDVTAALNDPARLRGLLGDYAERVLVLEGEVTTLQPKADVHDRIVESGGALTLREAATTLGIAPQRRLREWMRENGWLYGSGKLERAYQTQLAAGRMIHKVYLQSTEDGDEKSRVTVKITPKGLAKLAEIFRTVGAP